jgi:hypothetical protein
MVQFFRPNVTTIVFVLLQMFYLSFLCCSVKEGQAERTGACGSLGPSGRRCQWMWMLWPGALGRARRAAAAARGTRARSSCMGQTW